jgi:MFS superfamily sulfate permease-like transporter
MSPTVPSDDQPPPTASVGGARALERILFGPLPAALILVEALAVETRRGVNQVAAAACTTACHGVPTRLSYLKAATVIFALLAFVMVWRYWRRPQRKAGTVALAALVVFTLAAAAAPWWDPVLPSRSRRS